MFEQFSNVPAQALLLAVVGGLAGWFVAGVVEPLPAEWGILGGMALAIFAGGFNDPQLGVEQPNPSPPCVELAGECISGGLQFDSEEPASR